MGKRTHIEWGYRGRFEAFSPLQQTPHYYYLDNQLDESIDPRFTQLASRSSQLTNFCLARWGVHIEQRACTIDFCFYYPFLVFHDLAERSGAQRMTAEEAITSLMKFLFFSVFSPRFPYHITSSHIISHLTSPRLVSSRHVLSAPRLKQIYR